MNRSRKQIATTICLLIAGVAASFCLPTDVVAQNRGPRNQNAPNNNQLNAKEVQSAIDKAIRFLRNQQTDNGSWADYRYKCGVTSLVTLALLNGGEDPNSPHISKAIKYIKSFDSDSLPTYSLSLRIMALAAADPAGRIHRADIDGDIRTLLDGQGVEGPAAGGWTYHVNRGEGRAFTADASNTQFALLAMNDAAQMGIRIPEANWKAAKKYWMLCFVPRFGGFDYHTHVPGAVQNLEVTGSMTCAGIASTIIISDNLADGQKLIDAAGNLICCQQPDDRDMLEAAFEWLGKNLSVKGNPSNGGQRGGRGRQGDYGTKLYYLYALERAGRLSGRRFFGPHDWYRAGANELISTQKMSGAWAGTGGLGEGENRIATSFCLLFLSKGKRPVVVGKYEHGFGDDWDRHPKGVHQLTRNLEQQWNAKLTWQSVDSRKATVNELLETPVLFISGRDSLELDDDRKDALKKYIENGGFVFAEACVGDGCGEPAEGFDKKFRTLMAELFPDSPLEALPVDHPVWNAHFKIAPSETRPLLGLQACCRTSVIYCPRNLSGLWQADRPSMLKLCNEPTRKEVVYTSQLGQNVVSYATGRQVRDKLDTPKIDQKQVAQNMGNRIPVLPKLRHSGGSDEAPNAWRRVKRRAASDAGLLIKMEKKFVGPDIEEMADHPFIFMHGRDGFTFDTEERQAIGDYLSTGFGMILADSICTSEAFNESFRREMAAIMPDNPLVPIPTDDPLWTNVEFGTPVDRVTLRIPDRDANGGFRDENTAPRFEGIKVDDRWVVIFSPYDLSCALENTTVSQCEGYMHDDAMLMCLKILLYRLQVD